MSATATRHPYWHAPQSTHRVCIDDELTNAELSAIAFAKLKANGNGSHPQRFCDCPETLLHGKRVPCPPQHDCSYCRARGTLVDQAARIASQRVTVGYGDKIGEAADRWTKVFASEMDRLAAPLLRQSSNGSAAHNGVQNVEIDTGPVSSGRNRIDATSAVVPMW